MSRWKFELLVLVFLLSLPIPTRAGEPVARSPSSVLSLEKFRTPSLVEPGWYRGPEIIPGARIGADSRQKGLRVFRWSIRKKEAPAEVSQTRSVAFEKSSALRN